MIENTVNKDAYILVIDDSLDYRRLICCILHEIGMRNILEAHDANTAMDLLIQEKFDLVICDHYMPGAKGIELVSYLRNYKGSMNSSVPIILLTGEGRKTIVMQAAKAGIDTYLKKPISIRDLEVRINQLLSGKRPFFENWLKHRQVQPSQPAVNNEDIIEL